MRKTMTIVQRTLCVITVVCAMCSVSACSFDKIVKVDDPESEHDLSRELVRSRDGAIGIYYNAIGQLSLGVKEMSRQVGIMTDELTINPSGFQGRGLHDDARIDSINIWGVRGIASEAYQFLHAARINAAQARTAMERLNDSTLEYLRAATYAIEGYTIVMLAENICSGNPLSEVPFEGDIKLGAGLSTAQLFNVAIAKFDSSLAITHDSIRFINLARIGKGRAYMGLGEYAEAAAAVSDVGPDALFTLTYSKSPPPGGTATNSSFWVDTLTEGSRQLWHNFQILNREGTNGVVWYTTPALMDPRIPVTTDSNATLGKYVTNPAFQAKWVSGTTVFPLARWVEVKMIQAEHYLDIGDARWLGVLNEARRSVGLTDTTDPGTVDARVNLLFRERAYWFYLEATRLADFRRLVRQYGRTAAQVYPAGPYTRHRDAPLYGDAFVLSPPQSEYEHNYLYDGCINRNP